MSAIRKEVTIGNCRQRKKMRAKGHKQALKLFPKIGPCEKCGDDNSERHHIDDNPLNNVDENIMALCRRCHTLEHNKTFAPGVTEMGRIAAAKARRAIRSCPLGHPYSGDNLYTTPDGRRICKECNRIAKRKYRAGGGRG